MRRILGTDLGALRYAGGVMIPVGSVIYTEHVMEFRGSGESERYEGENGAHDLQRFSGWTSLPDGLGITGQPELLAKTIHSSRRDYKVAVEIENDVGNVSNPMHPGHNQKN
ncbi:MAG: hypothetical protein Q4P24_10800 [Rhodobacterales bacterium]|nr:hypothetical protein [Rhodobacterales bacterium]